MAAEALPTAGSRGRPASSPGAKGPSGSPGTEESLLMDRHCKQCTEMQGKEAIPKHREMAFRIEVTTQNGEEIGTFGAE